jgi:hypothetical protein
VPKGSNIDEKIFGSPDEFKSYDGKKIINNYTFYSFLIFFNRKQIFNYKLIAFDFRRIFILIDFKLKFD